METIIFTFSFSFFNLLCQGGNFCTTGRAVVKITAVEKIGKPVLYVENNYVNFGCISTPSFFCGKPLWKNMWRMWKSVSFQQVFRPLGNPAHRVENCA